MKRNRSLSGRLGDSRFRMLMLSAMGGGWNFIYAIYHLVLAVCYHSLFFFTMGAFYLSVCGMRASALLLKADVGDRQVGGNDERAVAKALRRNAFLTFGLAFIFSGVVCLTIAGKQNQSYHMIVAISLAAYSFYCVISAILNVIHLKKNRTVREIMLRNCSLVYAMGCLFGLERMMLGTFGSGGDRFTRIMEATSGAGIFLIMVVFGVNLMLIGNRKK